MNENQCVRSVDKGSVCAEPQRAIPSLDEAGEELVRALESALVEQALSRAKAREDDLERRIAALEQKVQEAVKPLAPEDSSPSKEGERHILVAPIKELASALVSACEEGGFRLESFVVRPLEGGESED